MKGKERTKRVVATQIFGYNASVITHDIIMLLLVLDLRSKLLKCSITLISSEQDLDEWLATNSNRPCHRGLLVGIEILLVVSSRSKDIIIQLKKCGKVYLSFVLLEV